MEQNIENNKVICYVGEDGLAVFRCPKCGTTRTIDTNDEVPMPNAFTEECECGESTHVHFEFRRHFRKQIKLSGTYYDSETEERGKIIVENLSLVGVGFRCTRRNNIRVGHRLEVKFKLDNSNESEISLWVEARDVKDRYVGTKRCDTQVQPELGFYLR